MEINKIPDKCWKEIGVDGTSSCDKLVNYIHCRNCPTYSAVGRTLLKKEFPPEYLKDWTELLSLKKEIQASELVSVLIFRLKTNWLALTTNCFRETVHIREYHSVPFRTNNIFKGLVNVNGELLLFFSVDNLLGIESENVDETSEKVIYNRLVILSKDGNQYVFQVDEIKGVVKISNDAINKSPITVSKSPIALTKGVFNYDEEAIGLLDETKFFNALKKVLEFR
jgi:chemotaxis-related protein WspD